MTNLRNSNVTKLKKSNCDKTKKNLDCDKTKKIYKCEETKKLQLWQNSIYDTTYVLVRITWHLYNVWDEIWAAFWNLYYFLIFFSQMFRLLLMFLVLFFSLLQGDPVVSCRFGTRNDILKKPKGWKCKRSPTNTIFDHPTLYWSSNRALRCPFQSPDFSCRYFWLEG